jgi:hypothetical protein
MNKTDAIMQFGDEIGAPKLAIDYTTAEDPKTLGEKQGNVIKDIYDQQMTTIKYFQSSIREEDKGRLAMVPRVIIAVEKSAVEEFCEAYYDKDKFSAHFLQYFILLEIKRQLEKQLEILSGSKYRREVHVGNQANRERKIHLTGMMREKIKTILQNIDEIIEQKKSSLPAESLARAQKSLAKSKMVEYLDDNNFQLAVM